MNSCKKFILPFLIVTATLLIVVPASVAAPLKTRVPILQNNGRQKQVKCTYNKSTQRWRKRARRGIFGRGGKLAKRGKRACKALLPISSVSGLAQLPGLSGLLSSKLESLRQNSSWSTRAVSGTPPLIKDLPELDPTTLFWRDGVVDRIANGNPTSDDCNEFFGSESDGGSAGFAGCLMAESSARALEEAFRSGTSICYMKNIPSFSGDGISVISGSENLPGGDLAQIFDTPSGSEISLVEIQILGFEDENGGDDEGTLDENEIGERIFIQIHNEATNKELNNQYGFTLNFCNGQEDVYRGTETTTVGRQGKIESIQSGEDDGGLYSTTVTGYVKQTKFDGLTVISYNPDLPRTLSVAFGGGSDNQEEGENSSLEKSEIVFTPQNKLKTKSYNVNEGRRGYSVIRYSGNSLTDAQFLEGGYKDEKDNRPEDGFSTLIEFRDSRYAAAPDSSIQSDLDKVDVLNDSFYTTPQLEFDSSAFDCGNQQPKVVLQMDFSNSDLASLTATCEGERLGDMDFCFGNDTIRQAEQNYSQACHNN